MKWSERYSQVKKQNKEIGKQWKALKELVLSGPDYLGS